MPEMRTPEGRERLTRPVAVTFERGNEAAYTRRRRAGRRGPAPVAVRNGLPDFKPYVYRGVGWDIYSGTGDDDA